jgi:hypothetical protein
VAELELGGALGLVDLAADDAAEVGQCELDAEADGAFAVWGAVAAEPCDVAACADEAGGGN